MQLLCRIYLAQGNWEKLNATAGTLLKQKEIGLKEHETVRQFLVQALFNQGRYKETLDLLTEVMAQIDSPEKALPYRLMLVRCLYETGQTDRLVGELPQLFRGELRENVTLNLTLLNIGDLLFDRQMYRKALTIYRLVLPKADLFAAQQQRLKEAAAKSKENRWNISELKQALESLQSVPDYDLHIAFRAAQIYSENKRFWEAAVLFDQIYAKYPSREEGKASLLQKILVLFEAGAGTEAVTESTDYLEKNISGLYPRLVCTRLAQYYLQKGQVNNVLALSRYTDRWTKPADSDELAQQTDILYILSFARFQLGEYAAAAEAFDRVIQTSPDSKAAIDSVYWKAMCRLLQKDYEPAYRQFIDYREKWPRADFSPAALFRAGVCKFGMEEYPSAKVIFESFIKNYPEDSLMPEALTMYGDLLGADGQIDEALASYDRAIEIVAANYEKATDPLLKKQIPAPATYAVFQSAQTLKADADAHITQKEVQVAKNKYHLLIERIERYMNTFGKDADWAQSVFWIGKAQMELGDTDKTVQAYLDTVVRYGADPSQEGVASILFDLAGIIKTRLDAEQRHQAVETIQKARQDASAPALQIRLDVLLAELNGTQAELGQALLAREKNLNQVPPSGLSLMCKALLASGDFSRAEEFFTCFSEKYPDSPFMPPSYQLRAEDLYQRNDLDNAAGLAVKALSLYGATAETGWAQLMKGKAEAARGDFKTATETFNMMFSVRAWRGPACAEAMFRMAEAWEAQGNLEKAFAFFQRTYLIYKAYDHGFWAAEGYLRSAQCLRKMGRVTAARNTYRAMLLDEYVSDLPQAQTAKEILGPEETAELLAGRTNTIETVTGESGVSK
jgi:TolA-binding protein